MGLDPQQYMSVWTTAVQAAFINQINPISAGELCFFAAQPDTRCETHDITEEVKAALYDWIPSDLAAIKEAEIIQVIGTHNHGESGIRCCQIASLATERGWHGGMVHSSRVDINEVMDTISKRYLPEGVEGEMLRMSADIDFTTMGDSFKANVEKEISKFREELDFLYPYPEEGGKT